MKRSRAVVGDRRSEFNASDPSLHAPPSPSLLLLLTGVLGGRSQGLAPEDPEGPEPRVRGLILGGRGRTPGRLLEGLRLGGAGPGGGSPPVGAVGDCVTGMGWRPSREPAGSRARRGLGRQGSCGGWCWLLGAVGQPQPHPRRWMERAFSLLPGDRGAPEGSGLGRGGGDGKRPRSMVAFRGCGFLRMVAVWGDGLSSGSANRETVEASLWDCSSRRYWRLRSESRGIVAE
ncbi:hypothetical protein CRUP_012059, partial [Coryphaenoides rupestris]